MPSITDSIGRVLGDRYRLLTALGTGASAHVYLADDVSLHRRVAIKVLHPALAGDEAFLRRFEAEARAVAALNHPNILRVYDWGEQGGEPYLVLEYLAGGSLRQIYDTGVLLSPEQAVHVGLEAVAGLDYAHRRGLVHRDIKPANLLLDGDRRLRIADFGLARALAEAAWTEPEGAILGTARYAAPEQVEGLVLDGKADVYALALVLYEGVTGEAAFVGDTTVATLMSRMDALLPEHEALGPLNDVLVWAAAPEPAERYDASQFGVELRQLADTLPEPEPLPIVEPPGTGESGAVDHPTVRPARTGFRGFEPSELTELGAPPVVRSVKEAKRAAAPKPDQAASLDPESDDPPNGRRRWPWITAVALVVAGVVAGAVVLVQASKVFTPSHPVPLLVGKSVPQARQAVRADHFAIRQTGQAFSITLAPGLIVSQRPGPKAHNKVVTAKQGSTISVIISEGLPPVAVPSLTSFSTCTGAVQALQAVHLVGACPPSAAQYSSTVVAGAVLGTSPTGTAPYGSTVTIITSKGHAPVAIPTVNAAGSTYAAASAALSAVGFVPAQGKAYSPSVPVGQVIGTSPDPSAGLQPFGSTVTVIISLGPQPVTIPGSVIGESVGQATAALQALGLNVAGPYGPPGSTKVLSTDPAPGTSVLPGTTVNVYTL
ncbi:MAG TPA: protein kinase [Acidimicrobiales bacterium]|jgi:serine/threonine-protein kinase|nr:protein kinase [Acidimicrobiales bacterium]